MANYGFTNKSTGVIEVYSDINKTNVVGQIKAGDIFVATEVTTEKPAFSGGSTKVLVSTGGVFKRSQEGFIVLPDTDYILERQFPIHMVAPVKEVIDGIIYAVFELCDIEPLRNSKGQIIDYLEAGTKVATNTYQTGNSYPTSLNVKYVNKGTGFKLIDGGYGFVNMGFDRIPNSIGFAK